MSGCTLLTPNMPDAATLFKSTNAVVYPTGSVQHASASKAGRDKLGGIFN
jgi:hypothetical protein